MSPSVPYGVVPAAGKAVRFGGGKLLAPIAGEPLLNRTIRSLLEAAVARVVVVLPAGRSATAAEPAWDAVPLLEDPRVVGVVNPDPSRGMFSSIQLGVTVARGAQEADPILVLPGDMPFVLPQTIVQLLQAFDRERAALSPQYGQRRGHPLVLPRELCDLVAGAPVDAVLVDLVRRWHGPRRVLDVADPGVLRDVDVPEDLTR